MKATRIDNRENSQREDAQTTIRHHPPHTPWSEGMVPYNEKLLRLDTEALNPKP
jgi:hypothetical protein